MRIIITPEKLLSALFLLGYERIHPVFYSLLMSKIISSDSEIIYDEKEFSDVFKMCAILDENGYHLKNGINMDYNVAKYCDTNRRYCTFRNYIDVEDNRVILDYIISNFDLFFVKIEAYDLLPPKLKRKHLNFLDFFK